MIVAAAVAISFALSCTSPAAAAPYRYLKTFGTRSYTRKGVFLYWATEKSFAGHVDSAGFPLYLEPDTGNYVYNPNVIAQWGLQEYSYFLIGKGRTHLTKAIRAGNWLVAHQDAASGKWLYGFVYYTKDVALYPPWSSALMQGQAMSLLTRLYARTHKGIYLQAAVKALLPFHLSVPQGGLVDKLLGKPFYEEYPVEPPVHVLNGFILTLLGMYDLSAYSREAEHDYRSGRNTLDAVLHLYDMGSRGTLYHLGYLTYHDAPFVAYCDYTRLHVFLLDAMNSIHPDRVFERYRDRWARLGCGPTA